MNEIITDLAEKIVAEHRGRDRSLVAIAGPPATGKSTVSEALAHRLSETEGLTSVVVPMDGFHLDNVQLDRLGLRAVKGAPETFDFDGFHTLLPRLRTADRPVYYPLFDRSLDKAVAGAGVVLPGTDVVIVEGNYLLLNEAPWTALAVFFDATVFLDTSLEVLEQRMIQRWLDHDHTEAQARERTLANDIPNAKRVLAGASPATFVIEG